MQTTNSSNLPRTHLVLLCSSIALGVLACAVGTKSGSDGDPVPVQTWKKSRGPVVPHDNFPRDCSICHEGSNWQTIRADFVFDHLAETGVALEGAHASAECLRCHNDRGPVKVFAQRGCAGCHQDIHQRKLGVNCGDCHVQTNWLPIEQIEQHNRTRFPLVGAHAAAACWTCHPGAQVGKFDRTDTACLTCHQADLARATNPDHQAQGWIDNCNECHIPTTWTGAGFNHFKFPLTGVHATTACVQCHAGNVFTGTPNQCVSCHLDEYNSTNDPPHASAGFPTSCQNCHDTTGWNNAHFDHSSFPLTGAHAGVSCNACHGTGIYAGTPTACNACHQNDFNNTTNPNHAASGFPTSCEQCHNTVAWTRANFNHNGVTSGCAQCHQVDYNNTTDPNHQAAGFPTTCQTCHNTRTWSGAVFNHPFPIDQGAHSNLSCVQCHQNPSNYMQFTCISCHEHDQPSMDSHHNRVRGYTYNSQACYNCHPNGSHR
jgi:hypothetical protein